MLHFNIEKSSEKGREGRKMLMVILEPLLGTGTDYAGLAAAVNNYCQTKRFKEGGEVSVNVRRFLDFVTERWHSNKKKRTLQETKEAKSVSRVIEELKKAEEMRMKMTDMDRRTEEMEAGVWEENSPSQEGSRKKRKRQGDGGPQNLSPSQGQ